MLLGRTRRSEPSLKLRKKACAGFLDGGNRDFSADGGVLLQKFVQCVAALEIIDEDFERDPSSAKDRFPTEDIQVSRDGVWHGASLSKSLTHELESDEDGIDVDLDSVGDAALPR